MSLHYFPWASSACNSFRLSCDNSLLGLDEQAPDEVLALLGDVVEGLLVEVPVAGSDVLERVNVVLPRERREAGQSAGTARRTASRQ